MLTLIEKNDRLNIQFESFNLLDLGNEESFQVITTHGVDKIVFANS